MGTRMSRTSLLFSTKKRNFWRGSGDGWAGQERGSSAPPLPEVSLDALRIPGVDCCRPARAPALPEGPAHLIEVTELPEEDQQLLMELDLLGRVGQVGLEQGVGEQPGYALEDELEVLGGVWAGTCPVWLPAVPASWPGPPQMPPLPPLPPHPEPDSCRQSQRGPGSSIINSCPGGSPSEAGSRAGLESLLLHQMTGSPSIHWTPAHLDSCGQLQSSCPFPAPCHT